MWAGQASKCVPSCIRYCCIMPECGAGSNLAEEGWAYGLMRSKPGMGDAGLHAIRGRHVPKRRAL